MKPFSRNTYLIIWFLESGTSNNECADIYLGPSAFSEPETQNMKAYVESLNPTPILGHSIHSYSQLWLWPYGYGYNEYPENYQEIVSVVPFFFIFLWNQFHFFFHRKNWLKTQLRLFIKFTELDLTLSILLIFVRNYSSRKKSLDIFQQFNFF